MARYVRADEAPVRAWITLLGIIPLYGGIGFAMTGYINFWVGIAILIATALAFAVHFWVANKTLSPRVRVSGVALIVSALALMLWFVFVPAPLGVVIDAPSGNYQKGEQIFGLEWREDYYPVNITISNDSDHAYENFISHFTTNLRLIARAGVSGGINQCIATPENTAIDISQATLSVPGKNLSIPLFQSNKQFPASIYRVRCDKISPHSRIDVILALDGSAKPTWAIGSFRYDAVNRHRGPLYIPRCFEVACPNMPSKFIGG